MRFKFEIDLAPWTEPPVLRRLLEVASIRGFEDGASGAEHYGYVATWELGKGLLFLEREALREAYSTGFYCALEARIARREAAEEPGYELVIGSQGEPVGQLPISEPAAPRGCSARPGSYRGEAELKIPWRELALPFLSKSTRRPR